MRLKRFEDGSGEGLEKIGGGERRDFFVGQEVSEASSRIFNAGIFP